MADPGDDAPPGFATNGAAGPPGLNVDKLADMLGSSVKVADEPADEPDLSLKLTEGLQENPETEIKTTTADETIYHSAKSFEDLPISKELLQGLYTEMKFEHPSRIQATTLPMILTPDGQGVHRDLIAQAHNGSGKTTCFVLAMLSRVKPGMKQPQALCMCPTRELVVQNLEVLRMMAKYTQITATSTADDDRQPRRDPIRDQVVIGTHGRLKNYVSKRLLDVESIAILVFDEADEMLKGDAFADDSVRLIRTIRKKNPAVQLLLFSATFNDKVKQFAIKIAPMANQVFVPKEKLSLDVITQYNVRCPSKEAKIMVLKEMIFPNCEKLGQTIIFCALRDTACRLHAEMAQLGFKCTSIQGAMDKPDRDRVVQEFRDGTTKILIATDVLARGFDVRQVTLVVNYDVPLERNSRDPAYETYLHRIGRSGRFGKKGAAFNLICGEFESRIIQAIADYFKRSIPEIAFNNDDEFVRVLNEAGLTDMSPEDS